MTADRQRVHKGVVAQIDRGYTKEWWWPMKDLQALALCIKFVWGLRRDWKIHLTVFIQLLLHLRLINTTCVKYTDQVLPHVSTPRLTWHHHIWENLPGLPASSWKWWRPGNKAVLSTYHALFEWDAEQIKLCTHTQLPVTQSTWGGYSVYHALFEWDAEQIKLCTHI